MAVLHDLRQVVEVFCGPPADAEDYKDSRRVAWRLMCIWSPTPDDIFSKIKGDEFVEIYRVSDNVQI